MCCKLLSFYTAEKKVPHTLGRQQLGQLTLSEKQTASICQNLKQHLAHAPNSHFDTWTLSCSRGGGTHILLEFIQSFDLELVFQGIIQRELLTWPFPLSVSDSQRGHPWASSPPWWQPIDQKSVAAKRWWCHKIFPDVSWVVFVELNSTVVNFLCISPSSHS